MQQFLEIVLIFIAFISVIPAVNMLKSRDEHKYLCLKFLIFSAAFWTLLIFVERTSTNNFLVYYSNMLGYPLKFLLSCLTLCTIFQYTEKKMPKIISYVLGIFLLVDASIALTNSQTNWFLNLKFHDLTSFNNLFMADSGPLFIFHLIACYLIMLTAMFVLFIFLAKHRLGRRQYKAVSRMMTISIVVVLLFNLSQLLFIKSNVDLTYISLVFVTYVLYEVIYRKDMVFNLRTSGRSEILSNMREMYILTDKDKTIIEISPLLLEKYNIQLDEVTGQKYEDLETYLKDKVVLYSEYNISEDSDPSKDHYHLREKEFKLKSMNASGYMILLYDETQIYNLLRELNRLSNFDSMTGLNNRNYIEHKLTQYNKLKNVGILSLDLNGLKANNDYLGHERGDYLLKTLANKMKLVFQDVFEKEMARIGGDEFLILVPNTTATFIENKKQELLNECDNKDIEKLVSVSIGTSIDLTGNTNIYQLIQEADQDMYDMKHKTSKIYTSAIIDYIKMQNKYIR